MCLVGLIVRADSASLIGHLLCRRNKACASYLVLNANQLANSASHPGSIVVLGNYNEHVIYAPSGAPTGPTRNETEAVINTLATQDTGPGRASAASLIKALLLQRCKQLAERAAVIFEYQGSLYSHLAFMHTARNLEPDQACFLTSSSQIAACQPDADFCGVVLAGLEANADRGDGGGTSGGGGSASHGGASRRSLGANEGQQGANHDTFGSMSNNGGGADFAGGSGGSLGTSARRLGTAALGAGGWHGNVQERSSWAEDTELHTHELVAGVLKQHLSQPHVYSSLGLKHPPSNIPVNEAQDWLENMWITGIAQPAPASKRTPVKHAESMLSARCLADEGKANSTGC